VAWSGVLRDRLLPPCRAEGSYVPQVRFLEMRGDGVSCIEVVSGGSGGGGRRQGSVRSGRTESVLAPVRMGCVVRSWCATV
jgi:hypothetical protein